MDDGELFGVGVAHDDGGLKGKEAGVIFGVIPNGGIAFFDVHLTERERHKPYVPVGTIEKTFDHVGEKFPEEARRIHYGEAQDRPIYGDATLDEAKALTDEGIKVAAIPWPKRRN